MYLANVLDITYLDLAYINELLEVIADDELDYTLKEELADLPFGQIDSNTLINTILCLINRHVYSQIKVQFENDTLAVSSEAEKANLIRLCEERIDEFSPYLNCIDSHFNNELDQVGVRGNTLSRIVDKMIPLLRENA